MARLLWRFSRITFTGVALLVGYLSPQPVMAQPAVNASGTSPDVGNSLDEIIVTAQKRSEGLQDVPMTITSTSGVQLESVGISDTRSLSEVLPGLTYAVQGAYAEPEIRGITTTTSGPGQDNPVATYVDGIYEPSQEGNIFNLCSGLRYWPLRRTLYGSC